MHSTGPINWTPMIVGFVAGFISRVLALRSGRSHFPGFPSGYISQIALGVIAAMVGSSITVSLAGKEFTAATFLTLAATQFRDVRNTERKTLEAEEQLILVGRGAGYIEGIAVTYEARNYLAMLVALVVSAATQFFGLWVGIGVGVASILVGERFMSGPRIGDVCEVEPAPVRFEKGSLLYAGDVMMMEVGLKGSRERYLQHGLAVVLTPKNPRGQAALWNVAQRQAIAHEAAAAVGTQKDVGYPEQTPLCRMEMPNATGRAGLTIIPVHRDVNRLIRAIKNTPVLESSKWARMPMTNPISSSGMGGEESSSGTASKPSPSAPTVRSAHVPSQEV
ncbi:MAG: YIEGIA family protein [Firmicutes bacterium]|nr:YIEGIA domain-containing protein [Alicyclobacillaceae bacterium]MCL6496463.1 YIEGIA family protein [Bacillota bacterium]